jgi:DHA1 family multidrug resistance protein-like MFS transporter
MLERAIFAAAVMIFLMGLVSNVQQLLVVRVIQGAFTGTMAAATTLVATTTPREKAGYALGLIQFAIYAGRSIGPLIGGLIADYAGYRPTFVFTSATLFVAGLCVVAFVREDFQRESDDEKRPRGSLRDRLRSFLGSPQLLAVIGVSMCVRAAEASISPILPLFIQTLLADSDRIASVAGTISAVGAVMSGLAAVTAGRQVDKYGYKQVLILCTVVSAVLLVPHALVREIWQLVVLRALVGVCVGGTFPVVNAAIAALAERKRQGAVYGFNASASAIGRAWGPMLGAAVATAFGFRAVFIATAVLYGLMSIGVVSVVRDAAPAEDSS